jgi:cytochrome c556
LTAKLAHVSLQDRERRPSQALPHLQKELPMRRFTTTLAASIVLLAAVVFAQAPAKIATLQDHAALMKSNAQAVGALNKALGSGAFADARPQVAALRTNFTTLRTFWTEKMNQTALTIVNDGLMRLDAMDKLLSAAAPDQMAAQAAAKEFGGATCAACHKQLREGDAQTGFKFREGMNRRRVVPGPSA